MSVAPVTVLIVDDNRDVRLALKLVVEQAGYRAELAANGEEALAAQRRNPAGIVITDILMPETDGLELIESFRREFPEAKVVAMSGAARLGKADYLPAARLLGVVAAVEKPVDPRALLAILRTLSAPPDGK